MNIQTSIRPRFSGHETFACRFTWLPKAVRLILRNASALSSDEDGMLELGLGKNMVRSLRFWLDAFDVAKLADGVWTLTPFGMAMFGPAGLDPYIERSETQWILHWKLSTAVEQPLFVWRHVLYGRMRPDFTKSELLGEMRTEGQRAGYDHSDVTLLQHAEVFLHSYLGAMKAKAPEDALDGPLIDLGILQRTGRREQQTGGAEPLFSLPQNSLHRVGANVVDYAIADFWTKRRRGESVISLRDLAQAEGSPGATFRVSSEELREHVEGATHLWAYRPAGDSGSITARADVDPELLLREIYQ